MNSPAAGFDVDFDAELPPGQTFFPVWQLAKFWCVTPKHVFNLIDSGELEVGIDLRNAASSKSTIRVPRKSVVDFLNRRKDLEAVAASNPAYPANSTRPARASKPPRRTGGSSAAQKRNGKSESANCNTNAKAMQKQHHARGRPLK